MRRRFAASIGLALVLALGSFLTTHVLAQQAQRPQAPAQAASAPRAQTAYVAPRTEDGRPDLHGNWSFATITPLQRPANLGERATLTDEEAVAAEQQAAATSVQDAGRQRGTAADVSRAYNDAWYDRGSRVVSTKQSSIIVDPPNGRIPPLSAEGQARQAARANGRGGRGPADGPEARSLGERCIIGFNAGPPFLSSAYNNNIRFVQTKDYVVIETEMVHDSRIVPLDGRPHAPAHVRPWMGDSRGRWEGDTLVVETTNFSDKNLPRGGSENTVLIERFTRTGANTLTYEFTLKDPGTWTAPWTGRVPMERLNPGEDIYEYACHEANYGMEGILKGARADERNAAAPAAR